MIAKSYRKYSLILLICILLVSFCISVPFMAKAELVTVEQQENPDLIYASIDGRKDASVWEHKGSLETKNGKYTLKSNGWAQWSQTDNLAFGYKDYKFDYGTKAQLTAEITMNTFDGANGNAAAGLMLRSGTSPGSSCVFMQSRPGCLMITYRANEGGGTMQGATQALTTKDLYPIGYKIVLVKTKAECYIKTKGSDTWVKFGTAVFTYGSRVYVGIGSYSQDQNFTTTSEYQDLSVKVEAPEGYESSSTSESSSSVVSSEENLLPEDFQLASDVLLRETFTDNSMIEGPASITNPVWKTNLSVDEIDIKTEPDNSNRYLYNFNNDGSAYFFAGDQHWTDYSTSMDLKFTDDTLLGEKNSVYIYVRHTDIAQYGYEDYVVYLSEGNTLSIGHRTNVGATTEYVTNDVSCNLDYLSDLNTSHNLKIEAFDNIISVYWDGVKLLSFTDTGYTVKGTGNIGFSTNGACVAIDNITVIKMEDPLGGDYDNNICDNWNEARPEYLDRFNDLPY